MTKHSLAASCALTLATLGLVSTSLAGTTMSAGKETKALQEVVKESCITGDIGFNITSAYVSRGSVLENQGFILQPYADIFFKVYSGDGFINSVTLSLGIWSSIHSERTDEGVASGNPGSSTTGSWYEFDYYPGISIGFAKNWTLSLTYLEFLYPGDGFFSQRLAQAKLAYNDADLLGAFALNPYVKYEYYFETPDEASYFEVGIAPGFAAGPVKVSLPITAGFGANEFYVNENGGNEAFGYVSGGVTLSYSLTSIPECYGAWTLSAGYTFYYLGDGLTDFNTAERGGSVRDQSDTESVFSGGMVIAF